MSKTKILHIIEHLTLGGAARAMIAASKYSSQTANYQHAVVSLRQPEPDAVELAQREGLSVLASQDPESIKHEISEADIVSLQWWNTPVLNQFLHSALPPCRLMAWFHVGGREAPQIITKKILDLVDFGLACSPYTYECPNIQSLSEATRISKTGMAYGAADFARLEGFKAKQHEGFNVAYIGTVDFVKIHPDFVKLSVQISLDEARFIVAGAGGAKERLVQQAGECGALERFDFRGYVDDIREVLEIVDVFGYPLCQETYAASEIILQEVMYAGIPPVVFPYGGVKHLVVDNFTGLVVNSAREYKQAIEYLYHNPDERLRLGKNASEYARQIFGAENAAKVINSVYEKLLQQPKKNRTWPKDTNAESVRLNDKCFGAELFIESLEEQAEPFKAGICESNIDALMKADQSIMESSDVMKSGGVLNYARFYVTDPYLRFWSGLIYLSKQQYNEALIDFTSAIESGFIHWRIYYYIAIASKCCGLIEIANNALNSLLAEHPEFVPAQMLTKELSFNS